MKILTIDKKLKKHEFTLYFESIFEKWSNVKLEQQGQPQRNFKISIGDKHLNYGIANSYALILADIMDLAVAIYTADRVCNQNMKYPAREITISLPLRLPEVFLNISILEILKDLLFWTTGTNWIFLLKKRLDKLRLSEEVKKIQFPPSKNEVALWSGGLDALAGLYYRANESFNKEFTLVGTGSNDSMFGKQKRIYKSLPNKLKSKTSLLQIPIRFSGIDKINKNYFMRSRGVVFALIGSISAFLKGQSNLYIYENGIGALNLPYSESSIGIDHSRSIHPITLYKVSNFLSHLLNKKFEVINPFLFLTKTEMLKPLYQDNQIELIKKSMSCDKPHREDIVQCGYCSSCILRRLSIYNAKFKDSTKYKIMNLKTANKEKKKFFDHMYYQTLRINKVFNNQILVESRWEAFSKLFPDLDEVIDLKYETETEFILNKKICFMKMYKNYINEWNSFYASI